MLVVVCTSITPPPLCDQVILMSATIEAQMFANYFSSRVDGVPRPAPRLFVEGRMHQVFEFFLDDIQHLGTVSLGTLVSTEPPLLLL